MGKITSPKLGKITAPLTAWNGLIDAPRIWCPKRLPGSLAGNEIKGACVLPSRPRPASRSPGRIHISDFRQHHLTCEGQPVHTCGASGPVPTAKACCSEMAVAL